MIRRLTGLAFVLLLSGCSSAGPNQAARAASPSPALTSPSPAALPATVWVNAGLGVNLRSAADVTSKSIEILRQGAAADVLGEQRGKDGSRWYHVRAGDGQEGWVSAAYVVSSAIYRFESVGGGWALMLPAGFTTQVVQSPSPGFTEARAPGSIASPFVRVQTAPKMDSLPVAPSPPAPLDHSKQIEVWSYTVVGRVYRTSEGSYLTVVRVPTPNRAYQFLFWTQESDSSLVNQVLASVSLSEL